MPDDPNDAQAKALTAALLPHLIAALKNDVLPSLIEDQIGGLKKNTDAVLDELKAARAHEKQMAETKMLADMLDPKKPKPDETAAVMITREDARSREKYQAAKALAEKRGVPLQMVGAQPDRQNHALDGQTHIKTETTLFIHKDVMGDREVYQRLKATAEREHLKFQPITDWKDLPEGAVPHD